MRRNSRETTSFHFGPVEGGFPGQRTTTKAPSLHTNCNPPYASLAAMFKTAVRHFDCVINRGCYGREPSVPVIVVEEKRSDRRQSGSFFLAGNFGLCSEIVGLLAWRCEHRIRRREDLIFSFGSERGPFPKDGPGHLGCRPSLSPTWRISPGCPWIDNFRGFGIRFDNIFLLLLHGLFVSFAFCFCVHVSRVDLDKHSFFCRFTGTVCHL